MRIFLLLICVLALCLSGPASARRKPASQPPELLSGGSALVARVAGDRLVLDDGREVRLVGLDLPVLGAGPAWVPPRFAEAAQAALRDLAEGRRVELRFDRNPADRYGRLLAHVVRDDGLWLQQDLLRRGFARVHGMSDNRAALPAMLAAEARARASHKGIWAKSGYAPRRAETASSYLGSFQIFEGKIVDGARVQSQVFLNFGADRDRDLTLRIGGPALVLFRSEGRDPLAYVGRPLRVRGWLRPRGRPLIDIAHPDEIEILTR